MTIVTGACDLWSPLRILTFPTWCLLLFASLTCCGASSDEVSHTSTGAPVADVAPVLDAIEPTRSPKNAPFALALTGGPFEPQDVVVVGMHRLDPSVLSKAKLSVAVPALTIGSYEVRVERGELSSESLTLDIHNAEPLIKPLGDAVVAEDELLELQVDVQDIDGDELRVFATGLPPGAKWEESTRTIRFRPDFIQGGHSHDVTIIARDGTVETTQSFRIEIADTIAPPSATVSQVDEVSTAYRLRLAQETDDYLDSPGYAGRTLTARIVVPKAATAQSKFPVRVYLHGLGGSPFSGGTGDQFRIYPHDPMTTYWWGYAETLPGPKPQAGLVKNYTQRRVLHLLEFVLKNYPGADPDRVYVVGSSMGGAGAAMLGASYARHFAMVNATLGQMVPRNHRPSRINQLSALWGDPATNLLDEFGMAAWDHGDVTRLIATSHESQQQFFSTRHGKDDSTIHFGAAAMPSALTGLSYYEAVHEHAVGHFAVWDEGGHGPSDPVLKSSWWGGHDFVFDDESFLRRDLPFIAFTNSEADGDPGDGTGNGNQNWSATAGYAGSVNVPGDTGWTGDLAGVLGRYLRWDAGAISDELDELRIPLRAVADPGQLGISKGYPPAADGYPGELPIMADGTLRRAKNFICRPGETVKYEFGSLSGEVVADEQGAVTVRDLPIDAQYTTLVLIRPAPSTNEVP